MLGPPGPLWAGRIFQISGLVAENLIEGSTIAKVGFLCLGPAAKDLFDSDQTHLGKFISRCSDHLGVMLVLSVVVNS